MRAAQIANTHVRADPADLAVIEWFGGVHCTTRPTR